MKKIALLLTLVLLLSGCAQQDNFTWNSIAAPSAAPTPQAEQEERVLRLPMPEQSGVLDPLTNTSQAMQGLMQLVYEPLVRLDESGKPVPYLAEGWTAVDDGASWVFTIRKGPVFHDGSALTAQDVSKMLDKIMIQGESSPWWQVTELLTSWVATDERTLTVRAKEPGYAILYAMTFPIMREIAQGLPVGTGPYRVGEYTAGQRLVLSAQTSWWKKAPNIQTVIAQARAGNESEIATMVLGELDMVRTQVLTASLNREQGVRRAQDYYTQGYDLLAFNFGNPVLANRSVREAISLAIDRRDIITNIYQNHAVSCEVPIPPDHWLHQSPLTPDTADTEEATRILRTLGFVDTDADKLFDILPLSMRDYVTPTPAASVTPTPTLAPTPTPQGSSALPGMVQSLPAVEKKEPFTLRLLTNYDLESPTRREAARRIAAQLGQVGLAVEVEAVSFDALGQRIEEGTYDLLLLGYQIPLSGDLRFLLDSGREDPQAGARVTRYIDQEMDVLLAAATSAVTDAQYRAAIARVQERIVAELPFVGLYFRTGTLLSVQELVMPAIIREGDPYRRIEEWYFE